MCTPNPTVAIVTFWQGIVEIILRVAVIVSSVIQWSTLLFSRARGGYGSRGILHFFSRSGSSRCEERACECDREFCAKCVSRVQCVGVESPELLVHMSSSYPHTHAPAVADPGGVHWVPWNPSFIKGCHRKYQHAQTYYIHYARTRASFTVAITHDLPVSTQ